MTNAVGSNPARTARQILIAVIIVLVVIVLLVESRHEPPVSGINHFSDPLEFKAL